METGRSPTKRVTVQEISAVDVPYFDMSLSESGSEESDEEENDKQEESFPQSSNAGSSKNSASNINIVSNSNAETPSINLNIKKEIVCEEENNCTAVGNDELENEEEDNNFNEEEESQFDEEEFEESEEEKKTRRKKKDDDDSDYNPDDGRNAASSESASDDDSGREEYLNDELEDETLIKLECSRFNVEDELISCFTCDEKHKSRSECKLYNCKEHEVVEDSKDDSGNFLRDHQSLPQMLRFKDDDQHLNGICAKEAIKPFTRFGPLVAEELMIWTLGFESELTDIWLTVDENDDSFAWTTKNEEKRNWFRYVRPANNLKEVNVSAVTIDKKLYFITTRPISSNDELRFWQDEHREFARWCVTKGSVRRVCLLRRIKFEYRHQYRMHMIIHHYVKPRGMQALHNFHCHVCNEKFSRQNELQKHCDEMHGGIMPFRCHLCLKLISNVRLIHPHLKRCNKNEKAIRLPCPHCDRRFSNSFRYKEHIKSVHLGLREYSCEICSQQFATSRSVKRHIASIHEGDKPHVCDKCGRCFSQDTNLKIHMLTHSGVKPFQCKEEGCTQGFTTKQSLQFHYQRVHKYTNEDMPDIKRAVPFTFEDHSINVDEEKPSKSITKRKKRKPVKKTNSSEDEESDWEKLERKKRKLTNRSKTAKNNKGRKRETLITPPKKRKPIEKCSTNEADEEKEKTMLQSDGNIKQIKRRGRRKKKGV